MVPPERAVGAEVVVVVETKVETDVRVVTAVETDVCVVTAVDTDVVTEVTGLMDALTK
jgi:hypothetical protein